jgi:hypothetical protein
VTDIVIRRRSTVVDIIAGDLRRVRICAVIHHTSQTAVVRDGIVDIDCETIRRAREAFVIFALPIPRARVTGLTVANNVGLTGAWVRGIIGRRWAAG